MSIKIDIHRNSRIWKIGDNKGLFFGQFKEEAIAGLFGKGIISENPENDSKTTASLGKIIDARFFSQIPEIAKEISRRVLTYPIIVETLNEL